MKSGLKNIRLTRVKALSKQLGRGGFKKLLFSDEKIFTAKEHINKQNNRYYAENYCEVREKAPRVERAHHPKNIMVRWGASYASVTLIHFCDPG